jgi:hypothetical protein
MNNYPLGAENDPRAPYNQKDYGECNYCEDGCELCDYTSEKTEQQYIDEYESFKEDTYEE